VGLRGSFKELAAQQLRRLARRTHNLSQGYAIWTGFDPQQPGHAGFLAPEQTHRLAPTANTAGQLHSFGYTKNASTRSSIFATGGKNAVDSQLAHRSGSPTGVSVYSKQGRDLS
jgi:hypothetical protein